MISKPVSDSVKANPKKSWDHAIDLARRQEEKAGQIPAEI